MKHLIALSFVALAVVVFAGCQNNGNKQAQPAAPVAPPAPAVTDVSPEASGPTTITPEPPRSPSARTPVPTPGAGMSGSGKTYTVQPHDTLYSISVKFYGNGKRVKDIADANGIADPSKISVGQVLKLP